MEWKRKSPSTLQVEKSEPEILRMERKASLLDAPVIRTLRTTSGPSGSPPPPSTHPDPDAASEFFGLEMPEAKPAEEPPSKPAGVPSQQRPLEAVTTAEPTTEPTTAEQRAATAKEPEPPADPPRPRSEVPQAATAATPAPAPAVSAASASTASSGAPKRKAAEEGASWIDIMIPGAQTVLHVKNPEEIEATSSDPNPQVAAFRGSAAQLRGAEALGRFETESSESCGSARNEQRHGGGRPFASQRAPLPLRFPDSQGKQDRAPGLTGLTVTEKKLWGFGRCAYAGRF